MKDAYNVKTDRALKFTQNFQNRELVNEVLDEVEKILDDIERVPKEGWRRYIESCRLYMNIPVHSNEVLDMICYVYGIFV